MSLPAALQERLQLLLSPADMDSVVCALAQERATCWRINPLLCTDSDVLQRLQQDGFDVTPVPDLPLAYAIPVAQRKLLTAHRFVQQGWIYLQNPSSMLPPIILDPQPGEEILDLTAAPGSKTLQLAAMMQKQGRLAAVEKIPDRFYQLKRNLQKHGAAYVSTYNKDGAQVWHAVPERFDRVLLDAPCSSEGQIQLSNPDSAAYWSERKIKEMAHKQGKLLYSAIQCCKPGGTIVYSTCTFAPEENEAIIDAALKRFGDALTVEPIHWQGKQRRDGVTQWQGKDYDARVALAMRVLPDAFYEGFFVCRLRKQKSVVDSCFAGA